MQNTPVITAAEINGDKFPYADKMHNEAERFLQDFGSDRSHDPNLNPEHVEFDDVSSTLEKNSKRIRLRRKSRESYLFQVCLFRHVT